MHKIIRVGDDPRPILSALSEGTEWADQIGAIVGLPKKCPVTRITPYREAGNGAMVPWLAVWKGDKLVERLNVSNLCEIKYEGACD